MLRRLHSLRSRFWLGAYAPGIDCRIFPTTPATPARCSKAFTLIEVIICLLLVLMVGIATIGGITYTRLNLELEKQRLSALNYARQAMEAIQSLDTAKSGSRKLVPFNSPDINDLDAALTVDYFDLTDDGKVDWSSPRSEPAINRPVYARVTIEWVPYGSMNRPQQVTMSTIVTRGID